MPGCSSLGIYFIASQLPTKRGLKKEVVPCMFLSRCEHCLPTPPLSTLGLLTLERERHKSAFAESQLLYPTRNFLQLPQVVGSCSSNFHYQNFHNFLQLPKYPTKNFLQLPQVAGGCSYNFHYENMTSYKEGFKVRDGSMYVFKGDVSLVSQHLR